MKKIIAISVVMLLLAGSMKADRQNTRHDGSEHVDALSSARQNTRYDGSEHPSASAGVNANAIEAVEDNAIDGDEGNVILPEFNGIRVY